MKLFGFLRENLPTWKNLGLVALSSLLLILAFPDFGLWILACFALVPLLIAIEQSKEKPFSAFLLGWFGGFLFFFGTCWWVTHAPITYASFPIIVAYIGVLPAFFGAGIFFGLFAWIQARLHQKFGAWAFLLAPFVWAATEFLRFQITGNAWNALAYALYEQADFLQAASYGGVYLVSFFILVSACSILFISYNPKSKFVPLVGVIAVFPPFHGIYSHPDFSFAEFGFTQDFYTKKAESPKSAVVIVIQPNAPMHQKRWEEFIELRQKQAELAEMALLEAEKENPEFVKMPRIVIFPEAPMNYSYANDSEFREFLQEFTSRNNVKLIFNSVEPARLKTRNGYHNSAVMVDEKGIKIAQHDKIGLMPFGEYVPLPEPFDAMFSGFVGSYQHGEKVRLMPFGNARGGVFLCFESLLPHIVNEFVDEGADFLVEMTNDGYLGNTPVLRQHLSNAVFRAIETNRPVLRVTNTGVTAYINERGQISDELPVHTEGTRVWTVQKADGKETFYVKYGDWFAWLCTFISLTTCGLTFWRKK